MNLQGINSIFPKYEISFKHLQDKKRDYEKPGFIMSVNRPNESDVFEKTIENTAVTDKRTLFHYVGKMFEDAGKFDIARSFYNTNFFNDLSADDKILLELDRIDLNRVDNKIDQNTFNQRGGQL